MRSQCAAEDPTLIVIAGLWQEISIIFIAMFTNHVYHFYKSVCQLDARLFGCPIVYKQWLANIVVMLCLFQPGAEPPYMSPNGPAAVRIFTLCFVFQFPIFVTTGYVPLYCSARSRILYLTLASCRVLPAASNDSSSNTTAPRAIFDHLSFAKYFSTSASFFIPTPRQLLINLSWPVAHLWVQYDRYNPGSSRTVK